AGGPGGRAARASPTGRGRPRRRAPGRAGSPRPGRGEGFTVPAPGRRRSRSVRDLRAVGRLAQPLQSLGEDLPAVLLAATLLHVREVRLVRLVLRRSGRVRPVTPGRKPAAWAVPDLRDGRVAGEGRTDLVLVGAPIRDPYTGCGLAALGLSHGAGADSAATDRVATTHRGTPCARSPRGGG